MSKNPFSKKKKELVPGTLVKCESGRWLAFYEHRTDIIANGENEKDAKANLKKMYSIVKKHEGEQLEKEAVKLPENFTAKHFTEKLECI
jgi:predicted RNase H-like HicB family nuclease